MFIFNKNRINAGTVKAVQNYNIIVCVLKQSKYMRLH